jgi:transcriptional regulator with XRE-family HTH domain
VSATSTAPSERTRPAPDRRGSIPARLGYLFATVRPPGGRPYSAAEVARWINDNGGKISAVYILKILSGERSEPSVPYLKDLAAFFGVKLAFFVDDDPPELDGPALYAQVVLRDPDMLTVITRLSRLSPGSRAALIDVLDALLRAEGKGREDPGPEAPDS